MLREPPGESRGLELLQLSFLHPHPPVSWKGRMWTELSKEERVEKEVNRRAEI